MASRHLRPVPEAKPRQLGWTPKIKMGPYRCVPSLEIYDNLQTMSDHFNTGLFGSRLRHCVLRLKSWGKTVQGYYHGREFSTPNGDAVADGITLNLALYPRV